VTDHQPADHLFRKWWRLIIVEQHPVHEAPAAWLFFMLSLQLQRRLNPF
jgi:hypothetical protein